MFDTIITLSGKKIAKKLGLNLHNLCRDEKWHQVRGFLNGNEKKEKKKAAIEWKDKDFDGCNSFYYACHYGAPVDMIQKMIDIAGDEIVFVTNGKDSTHSWPYSYAETPLHAASRWSGSTEIVELLINTGGKRLLMMQTKNGNTALHWACEINGDARDNSEVVKLLVQCGQSELTSIRNQEGQTASEISGGGEYRKYRKVIHDALKVILKDNPKKMRGEDFHKLCDDLTSYLSQYPKEWDAVRDYLNSNEKKETKKAIIKWKDEKHGQNSFKQACYGGPIDVIQKMIDIAGDEIVFVTNNYGETPLHAAVCNRNGCKTIVELLINVGGKRLLMMQNKCVIGCNTALHRACLMDDKSEVVKLLVQFGGSELTSIRNQEGQTASEVKEGKYQQVIQDAGPLKFYENFDDIRNLVNTNSCDENQTITIMPHLNNAYKQMYDFLQFKLLLTAVNAFHRLKTISDQDRVDLIHKMLVKAKNWCTSPFNTATYRVILEHLRNSKILTSVQQFGLEAAATETQISNADFIKEMQHMIANNTRRINNMEQVQVATIQSLHQLSESINEVQHNVEMVHEAFSKFVAGYEYKKRVEAGCDLVGAVLNACSIGVFGSAAKGIMGMTMASIVDFSDLVHVKEIATSITVSPLGFVEGDEMASSLAPSAESVSDMTLKESFDLGLKLAKDNLGDKRIDEAVKYHNSMVLISASAAIFSFKVDNDDKDNNIEDNVVPISNHESDINEEPAPRPSVSSDNNMEDNVVSINDHENGINEPNTCRLTSNSPFSSSSPVTFADRLSHLEMQLGLSSDSSSSGTARSRLHTLEVELFGELQEGTLISRIKKLEENILD